MKVKSVLIDRNDHRDNAIPFWVCIEPLQNPMMFAIAVPAMDRQAEQDSPCRPEFLT